MSKFIFESAVIDKSEKDILTGVKYDFSEKFNIVYGDNEAGKSSLMQFLKDGLFRKKGTDNGKIYFRLTDSEKLYRADIRDNRKPELRCRVFDNNSEVSYEIIENAVNKNYFNQGFTINLDDLMSIQNKDTDVLIHAIKDPSCDKLNEYYKLAQNKAKKIFGENNRLTKEVNEIYDKISVVNQKIKEISDNEDKYNAAVSGLEKIKNKILSLEQKEKDIQTVKNLMYSATIADKIRSGENIRDIRISGDLCVNSDEYYNFLQTAGKLETNNNLIIENESKTGSLKENIEPEIRELNNTFFINLSVKNIEQFNIKNDGINQIKKSVSEDDSITAKLTELNIKINSIQDDIIKLNQEKLYLAQKLLSENECEKLEGIYSDICEGFSLYNYILGQIDEKMNIKYNPPLITAKIFYLPLILNVLTIIFVCIFYNAKYFFQGILLIAASIIAGFGFYIREKFKQNKERETIIKELNLKKNSIINDMKTAAGKYDTELENVDNSMIIVKLEAIKQEIQTKLNDNKKLKEQIEEKEQNTECNKDKINLINTNKNELTLRADEIKLQIKELLKNNGIEVIINPKDTILFINKINTIKDEIELINKLSNENELIKLENDNLKNNLKNHKEAVLNELNKYPAEELLQEAENIKFEKEKLLTERENLKYIKRNLEEYKDIEEIKLEKIILLEEYRAKIFELLKQKLVIKLIEKTKENFNKNQPDIKNASKFLSLLTNGKYCGINLDLEEIQNSDGSKIKKWTELSRGTKEQLYLALRLGYASNYSKDRITMQLNGKPDLPVIIDDAFVNFDEKRTQSTLQCLYEFSQTNQVIFFTCRSEYINILNKKGDINVIGL